MKILDRGHRSMYDSSRWVPGVWREEPDAPADGEPCGVGFHSMLGNDPSDSPIFRFPCEVWEDEGEDELGRDKHKVRYRKQRITEEITGKFPTIVRINEFLDSILEVRWFQPSGEPAPEWMVVETYESLDAARDADSKLTTKFLDSGWISWFVSWNAAWSATQHIVNTTARNVILSAAEATARTAACVAIGVAAKAIAKSAQTISWHTARAARLAGGLAQALVVSDFAVDVTWIHRWWCAYTLGYIPLREDGEKLIVARIDTKGK